MMMMRASQDQILPLGLARPCSGRMPPTQHTPAVVLAVLLAALLALSRPAAAAADCSDYAQRLAGMRVADQSLREYIGNVSEPPPQRIYAAIGVVDAANTRQMKVLLKRCGWPVASKYGQAASDDAWLLIQHADEDRKFQHAALPILEAAVARGEARGGHLAYLTDRLAVAEGRPQLYGTQFKGVENCQLVLAPIDSREAVNRRRGAIPGMGTLEAYEQQARQAIAPPECRAAP